MTVLGKASQLISAERKDKLKPALNEDKRSLYGNDHTTSIIYLKKIYRKA